MQLTVWRTFLNESVFFFSLTMLSYGKTFGSIFYKFLNYDFRENRQERTPGRVEPTCTAPAKSVKKNFRHQKPHKFWGAPKITHFRLSWVGNFPAMTCTRSSLVDIGGKSRIAGEVWPPSPKNPKIGGP